MQTERLVVPDVTFTYDEKHDMMTGKSFDCRLGCAAMIDTMKELQGLSLQTDIVGACCSQEEVGTRGSVVTSRTVKPDIAIVFEGCSADDTCAASYMIQTALKKGPMHIPITDFLLMQITKTQLSLQWRF